MKLNNYFRISALVVAIIFIAISTFAGEYDNYFDRYNKDGKKTKTKTKPKEKKEVIESPRLEERNSTETNESSKIVPEDKEVTIPQLNVKAPVLTVNMAVLISLHPEMMRYSMQKQRFRRSLEGTEEFKRDSETVKKLLEEKSEEIKSIEKSIQETSQEMNNLLQKNQSRLNKTESQFHTMMIGKKEGEKASLKTQLKQEMNKVYAEIYVLQNNMKKKIARLNKKKEETLEKCEEPLFLNQKETDEMFEQISKEVKQYILEIIKPSKADYVVNRSYNARYYFELAKILRKGRQSNESFEYNEKEVNLLKKALGTKNVGNVDFGEAYGQTLSWLKKGMDEDFAGYFSNNQFILSENQDITPIVISYMLQKKGYDEPLVNSIVKVYDAVK